MFIIWFVFRRSSSSIPGSPSNMVQFKESKAQAKTREMNGTLEQLDVRFRRIVYTTTPCQESGIYNSVFGPRTRLWSNSGLGIDGNFKCENNNSLLPKIKCLITLNWCLHLWAIMPFLNPIIAHSDTMTSVSGAFPTNLVSGSLLNLGCKGLRTHLGNHLPVMFATWCGTRLYQHSGCQQHQQG